VRELEAQVAFLETRRSSQFTEVRETYSEASWRDLSTEAEGE